MRFLELRSSDCSRYILGEVCHITAARRNGPRYDPLRSPEERHGFENLILLCRNHHGVIDNDEEKYTVESLVELKRGHVASVQPLQETAAAEGAALIFSLYQTGGITAQTVNAGTINVHPPRSNRESVIGARHPEDVLGFFAPELARILAQQIHILDRATANFICASAKKPQPTDHWTIFRPWKPSLYPGATEFRDLSGEDGALLVEFYDKLIEIEVLITGWRESETPWDMNVWNYLMQKVQHSVAAGVTAAERFCPGRQFNSTMPTAGTLEDKARRSTSFMESALAAHIARYSAKPAPASARRNIN